MWKKVVHLNGVLINKSSFLEGMKVLGAMISSGKDGMYAAYKMVKKGHKIGCLITMKSVNPDSYMFHTPNVHLAELQAKAMEVPIVVQETKGEKEKELEDLEKALVKAKEYGIDGITTGALYSNYQRERIEKVCEKLGLEVFSPLWHMSQEEEMRSLLKEGFRFVLSSIAADGLSKDWLGKEIKREDIDKLVELDKKIGLNIAFEGGEAESLVLDCPMFKKEIVIKDSNIIMENEYTGVYNIIKAELQSK